MSISAPRRRIITTVEKRDALPVERVAHRLEMHRVRSAAESLRPSYLAMQSSSTDSDHMKVGPMAATLLVSR